MAAYSRRDHHTRAPARAAPPRGQGAEPERNSAFPEPETERWSARRLLAFVLVLAGVSWAVIAVLVIALLQGFA